MNSIEELIEDIKNGKMVILVDDEDRENEGDLILSADYVTPEKINFMAKEARGLICLSLATDQVQRLGLAPMVKDEINHSPNKTAFTVSIEASSGVTTGISAADRAHTIKVASNPQAKPSDVIMPGHIFPIRAQAGGVLRRAGHTEASVDMVGLAGLNKAAVICEIMNDDGSMARLPELKEFALKHRIKIGSILDLINYRMQNETLVSEIAAAALPTKFGHEFKIRVFRNEIDHSEHVLVQMGEFDPESPVLVRVHSECLSGDIFGSLRCDCGDQLHAALEMIKAEGRGAVLYLRQEGRGIGLANKIKAYNLQDSGMDTVEANVHLGFKADQREYGVGAQILRAVGIRKIRLMSNNPAKRVALKLYGLEIVERVPLLVGRNEENAHYLETKQKKMGHRLDGSHSWEP